MTKARPSSPAYNLLPNDILTRLPAMGESRDEPDPTLHVKWFTPDSGFTWYVAEYDPESRIGYGFVVGPCPEWGTFALDEIEQLRGSLGLPVAPLRPVSLIKDHKQLLIFSFEANLHLAVPTAFLLAPGAHHRQCLSALLVDAEPAVAVKFFDTE